MAQPMATGPFVDEGAGYWGGLLVTPCATGFSRNLAAGYSGFALRWC